MTDIIAPRRNEAIVGADGFSSLRLASWMEAMTRKMNILIEVVDMASKTLADGIQPTTTAITVVYTAPASGAGTRITAFTATNTSGSTDTYSVYIVPNGGTADATNRIIDAKSITTPLADVPAEVQEQLIPAGGTLEVAVSTGTTIAFRASGVEF